MFSLKSPPSRPHPSSSILRQSNKTENEAGQKNSIRNVNVLLVGEWLTRPPKLGVPTSSASTCRQLPPSSPLGFLYSSVFLSLPDWRFGWTHIWVSVCWAGKWLFDVIFFSCPGQLNRWPCQWWSQCVTHLLIWTLQSLQSLSKTWRQLLSF